MKRNELKEAILQKYQILCDAKLPGKGITARQIVEKYWDSKADECAQFRLVQIDLSVNNNLTLQVLKELAIRLAVS